MAIDAHQHFWRIGDNDCRWPTPDLTAIHRDFGPSDLQPELAAAGVVGTVLVQSQESDRDTDWLLGIAEHSPFVRGVVGWADLTSPDAPARITALAARPKLRGLRPMLQALPEDWVLSPAIEPAIAAIERNRLCFDALVYTRHLPALRAFAGRHPDLPIVIDHCAKPPIAAQLFSPWSGEIAELAQLPNVWCKLSGLLTEAAADQPRAVLRPYVEHVLDVFGDRVMWGSDWPVLNLAGGYGEWFALAADLCGLRGAALERMFSGAAQAFYGIRA